MIARIARAADVGRNYALLGAFGACLAGAWLAGSQAAPAAGEPAQPPGLATSAGKPPSGAAALGGATPESIALLPLPDELPPLELTADMAPSLEMAIAELPILELPPFDPTLSELGATPSPGNTPATGDGRVLHGRLSHAIGPMRRQLTAMRVASTSELSRLFEAHDYTLEQTRRGEPVPALQIDRVPRDLGTVRDGNERKALFIKALLPIVLETNERILAERNHLLRLHARHVAGRGLSVIERMWLAELADRYGTEADDFTELLRRVDVVPPSMAIAQAGVESGWGTSHAARTGNSLFGQIRPGSRQIPQAFPSVTDAVEAYFLNLNTHFAYVAFRSERARLRDAGRDPDGYHLIGQLLRYSELGHTYINFVRAVMRENRLADFDRARLQPI